MSFFSNLFKKKQPEKPLLSPKTRADLKKSFSVRDEERGGRLNSAFMKNRTPSAEEQKQLKDVFDIIESVSDGKKLIADGGVQNQFRHFPRSQRRDMQPDGQANYAVSREPFKLCGNRGIPVP